MGCSKIIHGILALDYASGPLSLVSSLANMNQDCPALHEQPSQTSASGFKHHPLGPSGVAIFFEGSHFKFGFKVTFRICCFGTKPIILAMIWRSRPRSTTHSGWIGSMFTGDTEFWILTHGHLFSAIKSWTCSPEFHSKNTLPESRRLPPLTVKGSPSPPFRVSGFGFRSVRELPWNPVTSISGFSPFGSFHGVV